ncbi:hypothetical protein Hanom_Chr09g00768031 [Helianthus anomalus]
MGLRIQERGAVFKGILFVHLANGLFLFNRSHLLLYLIHSVLFEYVYGPKSCFHKNKADFGIKISMG